MRVPVILALLAGAAPAHAARNELSFEWQGSFPSDQEVHDVWSGWRFDGYGLRGGYAVVRDQHRLGVVIDGGWVRARRQAEGDVRGVSFGTDGFATRYTADTFTLGLKADVDVGNVWYPYVHAQAGLVSVATALGHPLSMASSDTIRDHALAPSGLFTGGFELMIPDRRLGWPVTAALFVEAGYQVTGKMTFDTFGGPVNVSGAIVRSGIGLRM